MSENVQWYPKCKHCTQPNYYGKKYGGYCLECSNCGVPDLLDELATRDRQLAELRKACQPFAEYLKHLDEYKHPDEMGVGYYLHPNIKCGDFRRLAALLPPPAKEEPRGETK